ncbi:type I restriction-modification system subunit M [Runella sp.]|jgi:type I restriction enzyme M protein|uniref:type I restriction-modification system subunit M n=1 Tax=Runella sp. TaxID=1960881 RepID=UPI002627CE0A|nr:type I restriction-modification system subunit M [Runella sp.]
MAIKKSELYSSLWASCDELRGGMDASQYKDYVLVLLFVKYVSDKYADDPNALLTIPEGGSFRDMVAQKGDKEIGDKMNTIIGSLAKENDLKGVIDVADFNDDDKLGKGKEMVDKLTNLITIFENPALDFSKNRAEGDDILGDAYEYLMRHFATESGKSKGQFYSPGEVSRVMAKVLNIKNATNQTTFNDPTCGSGSLLLKAVDEADGKGSIYGQEKDVTTAALARMNMILHGQEAIEIHRGQSTLSDPFFKDAVGNLKTFDFIVANPPFSLKNWASGFNPQDDIYGRFDGYGVPPDKNGDYAFLLHIIKSLKSTGKAACILPHGVLFRGNAEAEIRKNLIQRGYIKGIIGLPANLFYGTGIPACIIVIDKEEADNRTAIFMIDAGKGFIKDGNKNRLREQDIHKIVDVFNKQIELPKYSRLVPMEEIADPKNEYNLNIPRYIDSQETEDIQDIVGHLMGDIPNADLEALNDYWSVYPTLKATLFGDSPRPGYSQPKVTKDQIKSTIFNHPEFVTFSAEMDAVFNEWKTRTTVYLKSLTSIPSLSGEGKGGVIPKHIITTVSEDILSSYTGKALMDKYDVYQHIMNYWNETMQDDCYLIAADGWKAEPVVQKKTKTATVWDCDLVPKTLVIDRYFTAEKNTIAALEAQKEALIAQLQELEEEHSGEDGFFADYDKVNKGSVQKRLKELTPKKENVKGLALDFSLAAEPQVTYQKSNDEAQERSVLTLYLQLIDDQATLAANIKEAVADLDQKTRKRYQTLTEDDIKQLVVDDKWMTALERNVKTEMERISQRLTQRLKELTERYETPLPALTKEMEALEQKVNAHLKAMGFSLA